MSIELIVGYVSSTIIGISLGLIGGGGSILAVPVLAYLFHQDEKFATAYSLFIVGSTALVGGIKQNKKGFVNWKVAIVFGIPAIMGLSLVRRWIIPQIPDELFHLGTFTITRRILMFGLFALLMIPAAFSMLKNKKEVAISNTGINYPVIIVQSLFLGMLLGFVGAGGGFLFIPALITFAHLDMKTAIGTSLIIIAMNSLLGFLFGDAFTTQINWTFLFTITTLAIFGIYIGSFLGNFIDGKSLKKAFGYFIILMSLFIFYMEFFVKPT